MVVKSNSGTRKLVHISMERRSVVSLCQDKGDCLQRDTEKLWWGVMEIVYILFYIIVEFHGYIYWLEFIGLYS